MNREKFIQRKKRVKAKIMSDDFRPRLSVFRSNKFVYAQVIDDIKGITLASASSKEEAFLDKKETVVQKAFSVGETLAKKALAKKVKKIVFDKSGYKYHGVVKAVADGARKGGLEF